ncbi:MAG TPA: ATP-binding cassette domain-containing protein [Bacteroidales bacterium]|nr:ATP-binding cassette domain-containing protein [Bacteroidales bacterium]
METKIVLETRYLSKNYGKVKAINNLNLQVFEGQVFGILGPNGSGKTTTLSIVTGILEAASGSHFWFGESPAPKSLKRIGSMIEVPHFYPYLNLDQNLKIVAEIKGYGASDIDRVLQTIKLIDRRRSKFSTLSLGMKQRLGIGAALLGDPEVLVLDEPTNGLDPEGIAEVRTLIINEALRGKTVIMASHILSEVEKVCTHVAILKNGVLLEQGDVNALLKGEMLVEVKAEDQAKLGNALEQCEFVSSVKAENGSIMVTLSDNRTSADLNAFLFEKGVRLTDLINHKKSLESQFLELVKED